MTTEQLTRHLRASPFVPFQMCLADGRVLDLPHPELLLYIPGARTCIVADVAEKVYEMVDLLLVTSLRIGAVAKRRAMRRR